MLYDTQQIDSVTIHDFNRARFKATVRGIINRLLGKRNRLLPLEAALKGAELKAQHSLGVYSVPINQIVGSNGRTDDFDQAFYPLRDLTQHRWVSVDKANHKGVALPPVELRKVGEQYFVMDGHHRISVAREHGQRYVDAYVVEMVVCKRF